MPVSKPADVIVPLLVVEILLAVEIAPKPVVMEPAARAPVPVTAVYVPVERSALAIVPSRIIVAVMAPVGSESVPPVIVKPFAEVMLPVPVVEMLPEVDAVPAGLTVN